MMLVYFAAIKACEDWYFTHHIIPLNKEVANKSELLQESEKTIKNQNAKIEKLEKELSEKSELLKEVQELIENQNVLLSLNDKPLPKTPSKFKSFKVRQ